MLLSSELLSTRRNNGHVFSSIILLLSEVRNVPRQFTLDSAVTILEVHGIFVGITKQFWERVAMAISTDEQFFNDASTKETLDESKG